MLVQLLDYSLDVVHQPDEMMYLCDALSRLYSHDNNDGKTIKSVDVYIHSIEELTGFNALSVDKICQHTNTDSTLYHPYQQWLS